MLTAKNLANACINKLNRLLMRVRLSCQYRFGLLKEYQPNPFDRKGRNHATSRECAERFEAISRVLPNKPFSFMDLGCNSGYFVFRLAERGGFGLGIEAGRNEIMVCQSLAALHRIKNVSFSRLPIAPENSSILPKVDVVVFMSVFHHFVRHFGPEAAMKMLSDIASKAERFLIFETGQPNEDSSWADKLSFMGNNPKVWIIDMLKSLGFDLVHDLGQFSTSVSAVKRHLLIGERTVSIKLTK